MSFLGRGEKEDRVCGVPCAAEKKNAFFSPRCQNLGLALSFSPIEVSFLPLLFSDHQIYLFLRAAKELEEERGREGWNGPWGLFRRRLTSRCEERQGQSAVSPGHSALHH